MNHQVSHLDNKARISHPWFLVITAVLIDTKDQKQAQLIPALDQPTSNQSQPLSQSSASPSEGIRIFSDGFRLDRCCARILQLAELSEIVHVDRIEQRYFRLEYGLTSLSNHFFNMYSRVYHFTFVPIVFPVENWINITSVRRVNRLSSLVHSNESLLLLDVTPLHWKIYIREQSDIHCASAIRSDCSYWITVRADQCWISSS